MGLEYIKCGNAEGQIEVVWSYGEDGGWQLGTRTEKKSLS